MPQALLERTLVENPFIPHVPTPPQIRFLELECLDSLFGGAAGPGKSTALLMAALQFMEVPGYSALILRRSFTDLSLPGALIDRARDWLTPTEAVENASEHRWRFPSGASLQFGYCDKEKDVQRYQSSEFQTICIDEASQFSERQIRFLFSRLRRARTIPVPLRFRLASNPGGVGHEFIKSRYIRPGTPGKVFIPARLDDNPYIDREQYLVSLSQLDPITRAQLLAGDWDAHQGGRFKREWLKKYKLVNLGFGQGGEYDLGDGRRVMARDCWRFITVDPAASEKATADWTVIAVWAVTPDFKLLLIDCHRLQVQIPDIVPQIQQAYSLHLPEFVAIEAVASNRAVLQFAMRTDMIVKEVGPRGLDKLVRATPAMVLAESGRLWLPERAHWLDDVESELLRFTGDPKLDAHDDVCDALSYASVLLGERDEGPGGAPMILGKKAW